MTAINPASGNTLGLPDQFIGLSATINPMTRDEIRLDRDRLDGIVTEADGLVRALQIVLWDFCQEVLEGEVNRKRRAIIALGDALQAVFDRADGRA